MAAGSGGDLKEAGNKGGLSLRSLSTDCVCGAFGYFARISRPPMVCACPSLIIAIAS